MALTKFEKDMVIVQKLDDEPNDVGGLTSAELKAKFDEGGEAIKKYINETLTSELDSGFSGKVPTSTTINGKPLTGNVTITKADVGLGQADNTPDLQKPLSTQQKAYIDKVAADFMIGQFQSPLQIGQGGTGSKTAQEALAALGAAVQDNELDNAYFVGGGTGYGVFPVNQRGKTQYTELGPMFDRWKLEYVVGSIVELTPDGLTILGGTPYSLIRSSLRRTLPIGATYTITVLFYNGTMVSNVITVPTDGNPSAHTPITPGGTYVRLFGPQTFEVVGITGDKTPEIELIKLEQGNRQTAAYQKSDGKWSRLTQNLSFEQTLANCQAYQIELNCRRLQNPTIGTVVRGTSSWYVAIPLPTTMRVAPAIKIERGTPTVECQDGAFQVSQLTPLSTTSSMALFVLKFSGGSPTTASSGTLYVAGTGTGADAPSVILDANL